MSIARERELSDVPQQMLARAALSHSRTGQTLCRMNEDLASGNGNGNALQNCGADKSRRQWQCCRGAEARVATDVQELAAHIRRQCNASTHG